MWYRIVCIFGVWKEIIIMDLLNVHDYCIHNHILFRFNLKLNIGTKRKSISYKKHIQRERVEELYMREINVRTWYIIFCTCVSVWHCMCMYVCLLSFFGWHYILLLNCWNFVCIFNLKKLCRILYYYCIWCAWK